mmetsp:Transcript_101904/g.283555  ORF Transcript_101904/g.283555 Transcript_101904/m.283555 type:complete len:226 (-) Transcript_101904:162-839(-)
MASAGLRRHRRCDGRSLPRQRARPKRLPAQDSCGAALAVHVAPRSWRYRRLGPKAHATAALQGPPGPLRRARARSAGASSRTPPWRARPAGRRAPRRPGRWAPRRPAPAHPLPRQASPSRGWETMLRGIRCQRCTSARRRPRSARHCAAKEAGSRCWNWPSETTPRSPRSRAARRGLMEHCIFPPGLVASWVSCPDCNRCPSRGLSWLCWRRCMGTRGCQAREAC